VLTSEPEDLLDRLTDSLKFLAAYGYENRWQHRLENDDYLSAFEGDECLTEESRVPLAPGGGSPETIAVRDVLTLAEELREAKLEGGLFRTPRHAGLLLVQSQDAAPSLRLPVIREALDGAVRACLQSGGTPTTLFLRSKGLLDNSEMPSALSVEVSPTDGRDLDLSAEEVREVVLAHLFELSSCGGVDLSIAGIGGSGPRVARAPAMADLDRARALITGDGMADVYRLFNEAAVGALPEHRILGFFKVIEWVAVTVVRRDERAELRRRLAMPEALAPPAGFLDDLVTRMQSMSKEHGNQKVPIRLTLGVACEPESLKPFAPACVDKLVGFDRSSRKKGAPTRDDALNQLADCLTSTRNGFAHAGANFTLRQGDQPPCPPSERAQLAECAKVAAEQVIHWYASLADHERIS
jgi:hypothetical protein